MPATAQILIRSCDRRVLELEQVKAWLLGNGLRVSADHQEVDPRADLIILTTCGVTQAHEDFTFALLRRIEARKQPGAQVILGGCVPEINPQRVAAEFGGATFSPQTYPRLDEILRLPHKLAEFPRPHTYSMAASYRTDVGNLLGLAKHVGAHLLDWDYLAGRLRRFLRAFARRRDIYLIQIHEGCSLGCTYCAIQKAIGPLRNSLPVETVLSDLNRGLDLGYRRIRLLGDSAGSYGLDIGTNLGVLLRRIAELERPFELELTDINPVFLPVIYEPVKELCAQRRLASLYIPIQSGSARILRLMHRRCDLERVQRMLSDLRAASPGVKLGTSVIVGFPSETLDELAATAALCNAVNFDWIWCHGFSPRPGTPAAALPDQFSPDEVQARINRFTASIQRPNAVILDLQ